MALTGQSDPFGVDITIKSLLFVIYLLYDQMLSSVSVTLTR